MLLAFCSNLGKFVKAIGRNISLHRLEKSPLTFDDAAVPVKHEKRSLDIIEYVVANLDQLRNQVVTPYGANKK